MSSSKTGRGDHSRRSFIALAGVTGAAALVGIRPGLTLAQGGAALPHVTESDPTAKALGYGVAPVPAFAMGVLTACFGGIVRDVLAGEPSILMRPELYVTAAAVAAGLFVGLVLVGAPVIAAAAAGALAGFALRGLAIARGWKLPAYKD